MFTTSERKSSKYFIHHGAITSAAVDVLNKTEEWLCGFVTNKPQLLIAALIWNNFTQVYSSLS